MALRDTSWILDTAGAVIDSHFIETNRQATQETMTIWFGIARTATRNRTKYESEALALTASAAKNFVDTRAGDTNSSYEAVEDDRYTGAWKVLRHVDSVAAWSFA